MLLCLLLDIPLEKIWTALSPPAQQVLQLFIYKNVIGIKYPMKVHMPLNKENKKQQKIVYFMFKYLLFSSE